ncbi:MAG: MucB/RseB C-terminal domain-containing protein [Methylothermaceae bacterium]|nr:MucB/RseB C-terminal domain-containing protein [Methylothermaceae bacterium]
MPTAKMDRRSWCQTLGWLLACWSVLAVAVEPERRNPGEWLRMLGEAMQHLDYRATVVYTRDNRIQTLRLTHRIEDGVIHEHLQTLNDPLREVIREAGKVTCYFPERRTIVVESRNLPPSLFGEWSDQRQQQTEYYRLALGRQGHEAGRAAQEIVIEPADSYRYGRRIWVDRDSKLPLKLELLNRNGEVLEAIVVTELGVGGVEEETSSGIVPEGATEHWKVLTRKEEPAERRWRLAQLPPGFQTVRHSRRVDPIDAKPIDHILITDGLGSVSVYIKQQDADDEEFDPGKLRLGAVNVYNKRIDGYLVTVLGDVPPETVRLIGDGVQADETDPVDISDTP